MGRVKVAQGTGLIALLSVVGRLGIVAVGVGFILAKITIAAATGLATTVIAARSTTVVTAGTGSTTAACTATTACAAAASCKSRFDFRRVIIVEADRRNAKSDSDKSRYRQ